jgi:hypothetical protein
MLASTCIGPDRDVVGSFVALLLCNAAEPTAVVLSPLMLLNSARVPSALFDPPVVLLRSVLAPAPIFDLQHWIGGRRDSRD